MRFSRSSIEAILSRKRYYAPRIAASVATDCGRHRKARVSNPDWDIAERLLFCRSKESDVAPVEELALMAEQPLSSDHEAASVLSAPAQRAPPDVPRARRRPWSGITLVRLAVLIAAGVIVVLFATQWDRWIGVAVRQVTDDAYVRGDITPLSAHIEGYVRRVPVDDFQRVKEGEVLVQIEDDDSRARVAQAEADPAGGQSRGARH